MMEVLGVIDAILTIAQTARELSSLIDSLYIPRTGPRIPEFEALRKTLEATESDLNVLAQNPRILSLCDDATSLETRDSPRTELLAMSTLLNDTEALLFSLGQEAHADLPDGKGFSTRERTAVWDQSQALRSRLEAIKTFQSGMKPSTCFDGQDPGRDTTPTNMPAEKPNLLVVPMDRYLHDTEKCSLVPTDTSQRGPREQRKRAIEVTLVTLATCSSYAMERFARPEAQPSAALFVTAIGAYASSAGSLYYLHSDQLHLDFCLLCGGLLGLVAGWVAGWDYQEIVFRSLPGFILASLLVGIYCLRRR